MLVAALAVYAFATSGGVASVPVSPSVLMFAALIAFGLFVIVETRMAAPLVLVNLPRDRGAGIGFETNLAIGTLMMSTLVVGAFSLSFSLGLSEAHVGLVLAVGPAVATLSGVPAGWSTDRLGASRVMVMGLVQIMIGLICLACLPRLFGVGGMSPR